MRSVLRDVRVLSLYDVLREIYVVYERIYDLYRWRKGCNVVNRVVTNI